MKKNFTFIFAIMLCLFYTKGNAQTQFWSDTFEDTGAPSAGLRVPSVAEFSNGSPAFSYFFRTLPGNIILQAGPYSNIQGSKIWAAEDIDKGSTGVNNSISPNQQVTWTAINIAGKSGLSFKGIFAANNLNAGWNGTSFAPNQDFLAIEYRIDGGLWTKIIAFYAGSTTTTNALSLDTNGDLIGDGASLGYAFSEFSANITGTGTLLEIRLNCSANGSDSQEFAVDDFRLFETPACTAPVVTTNPPNRSICNNSNTTFTVAATGATAYKWQVDQTGLGTYSDIANGGIYSGATTSTLTITGAIGAMTGYRYRAVAINGVPTCFTNSNYGTLNVSNITILGAQDNIICAGGLTGSASVIASGGIGTYTYMWSPSGGTGAIASNLGVGTYTVTVTDGIACTATKVFNIIETGTPITITPSHTNVSCFNGANGTATATVTGGTGVGTYTYSWVPSGGSAATAAGLAVGPYTVTVTDENGCSKQQVFNITAPSAIITSIAGQTNVSCNGGSNGSATVGATGGTGPGTYTYSWVPSGGNAATASGLTEGTYTVTVTDANTCSTTQEFIITEPIASILSITRSNNTLTADQAGATYQWFTCPGTDIAGEISQSFTPTANGSYGVAISLNGCTVLAPCVNVTNLATKDFEEKSKFMIYPNPSQGIINIKSELDTDLNIINQSGQIVKTVKVTADNINTIHIENLSDGIYFIRDTKGNKPFTHKLVLKK